MKRHHYLSALGCASMLWACEAGPARDRDPAPTVPPACDAAFCDEEPGDNIDDPSLDNECVPRNDCRPSDCGQVGDGCGGTLTCRCLGDGGVPMGQPTDAGTPTTMPRRDAGTPTMPRRDAGTAGRDAGSGSGTACEDRFRSSSASSPIRLVDPSGANDWNTSGDLDRSVTGLSIRGGQEDWYALHVIDDEWADPLIDVFVTVDDGTELPVELYYKCDSGEDENACASVRALPNGPHGSGCSGSSSTRPAFAGTLDCGSAAQASGTLLIHIKPPSDAAAAACIAYRMRIEVD